VRLPGRFLAAEDEFFKAVGYRMELNARAYRQAVQEGLEGERFAARVQEIINNPPEDLRLAAVDAARYQTFTKPLGEAGTAFTRSLNKMPVSRFIMPFIRTPVNIMKYVGERTPLAPISGAVRQEIRAGGARRDLALAKIGLGSMLMATFADMASSGLISGNGPTDRELRASKLRTGWKPYSVKMGDQWVAFNRLDPIGATLGISADLAHILGQAEEADADEIAAAAVMAVSQNIVSKTYMSGVADVMEVFASVSPEAGASAGERWLRRLAGTLIPAGVAQTTRVLDPTLRQTTSMVEAIRARIPGLSDELPPRLNLWGAPIELTGGVGPDIMSPLWSSPLLHSPADEEMVRLGMGVSMPRRTIGPPGFGVEMTPQEYNALVKLAGNDLKVDGMGARETIEALVTGKHDSSFEYQQATDGPDGGKAVAIAGILRAFRELAKGELLNPDSPHYQEELANKVRDAQLQRGINLGVQQ
jgi:hypothetical protein